MRERCGMVRVCGLVGLVVCLASGCTAKKATVSGKVLFKGGPLPGGIIALVAENGKNFGGDINETGEYSVKDVPPGTYRVMVDNTNLQMQDRMGTLPGAPPGTPMPEMPARKPGRYVPIPEKFRQGDTSGLSLTVASGDLTGKDIELK
jgi:hypothetical protein